MKKVTLFFVLFMYSFSFSNSQVDDLIKYSGIGYELKNLPEQFIVGLQSGAAVIQQTEPELYDRLIKSVTGSFDYDKSIAFIKQTVERKMSKKEIKSALKWLTSDLGVKITALEDALSEPENAQKALAFNGDIGEEKKKCVDELIAGLKIVDKITDITLQTSLATAYAVASLQSTEETINLEMVKSQIDQMRPAIQQQFQQVISHSMYYGYKDLDVKELKKYVKFNISATGLKYNETLSDATFEIVKGIVNDFAHELIGYFKEKGKKIEYQDI